MPWLAAKFQFLQSKVLSKLSYSRCLLILASRLQTKASRMNSLSKIKKRMQRFRKRLAIILQQSTFKYPRILMERWKAWLHSLLQLKTKSTALSSKDILVAYNSTLKLTLTTTLRLLRSKKIADKEIMLTMVAFGKSTSDRWSKFNFVINFI